MRGFASGVLMRLALVVQPLALHALLRPGALNWPGLLTVLASAVAPSLIAAA